MPEARGLGAGRALGEAVLVWARDAGHPTVVTDWRETNLAAEPDVAEAGVPADVPAAVPRDRLGPRRVLRQAFAATQPGFPSADLVLVARTCLASFGVRARGQARIREAAQHETERFIIE